MMRYSIQIKMMGTVLLLAVLSIRPMDPPKKAFDKLSDFEENNIVVHFARHELSDQDDPLVLACAKNNIPGMQSAANKISKNNSKANNIICQALYYAVKNNNKDAFELLRAHKKTSKWAKSNIFENIASFIQLAIFNGSWQVMPKLINIYLQGEAVEGDLFYTGGSSSSKPQPDIFEALSSLSSVVMRANLFEIIKAHHSDIITLFKTQETNLKNYIESIKTLFSKKEIQALELIAPFLADNDPCKTSTKGTGNKDEKCIIS